MTKEEKDRLLRLYELLWEEIKETYMLEFGLCNVLDRMYVFDESITMREFTMIVGHIRDVIGWGYGWPLTIEGTAQRKSFVLEQIEKLKKEE